MCYVLCCYVLCCYVLCVMLLCVMLLCCYVFKGAGGYLILWVLIESLGGYFSKKLVKKYYS